MTQISANELARAYVVAINSPANGWGQHAHPTQGRSDWIMLRLIKLVGEIKAERLITDEMTKG